MDDDDKGKSGRSGTEKRARGRLLQIRLTDAELAEIQALADRAELTPASYARAVLLDTPAPRARRRAAGDTVQVAKMLGELGKVGSNLNQLAHHANAGLGVSASVIEAGLADVAEIRRACMEALGRKP